MAFQSVPGGAEFIVRGVLNGQNVVNTFYAIAAGSWGLPDLQAACDAVDNVWSTGILPLLQGNYTYVRTDARDLRTAVGLQCTQNAGTGAGGNLSGGKPNNVTLAISRNSGLSGRASRGRIYLPSIPANVLDDENTVGTTFAAAVETALNGLQTALGAVDWLEVIVSRTAAGVDPLVATVYTVIEYVVIDRTLDSMRRRLPGRGT